MSTKDSADYGRNHYRVKAMYGKASEYGCWGWPDSNCDNQAAHWAQQWRYYDDPADPEGYIPLCRKCHAACDYEQIYTAETLAKISDFMKGNRHLLGYSPSPETRAKISAASSRYRATPETRAKISASQKARLASPEVRGRVSTSLKAYYVRERAASRARARAMKEQREREQA